MNKAIFLDRDGTIIKDKGYIGDIKDVVFYDYTFDMLKNLQEHYMLFIITNQSGIAKKEITHDQVIAVNNHIMKTLKENGVDIKELYMCPHQPSDECLCIKPKTYYIKIAQEKYDLDLRKSFVIGDHDTDARLAFNIGAKPIYLLTGHGRNHLKNLNILLREKIKVVINLKYAARYIIKLLG